MTPGLAQDAQHAPPGRVGPWAVAALLLLAGCGGARLTETTPPAAIAGPPPQRLLVVADAGAVVGEDIDPQAASSAATRLTDSIVAGLRANGSPAEVATAEAAGRDTARLAIALTRYQEGSRIERLALGFGLGQSRLEVTARLLPPATGQAPAELLGFQAVSHSGYRPGLVTPLAVGLLARAVVGVVLVGRTAVDEVRGRGPSLDSDEVAAAVVTRTTAYFRQVGWDAPAAPLPAPAGGTALAGPQRAAPRRG